MKLDVRTITFVIIIGSLLMSAGLFSVARGYMGQVHGLSRWAKATLIQALGWIIVGALRGSIPDVMSIVLGNGLIQLSLAKYLIILAQFNHKPIRSERVYAIVMVVSVLLFYFSAIDANLQARNIIVSVSAFIFALISTHLLMYGRTAHPPSHTFTASLFALCGGFMLFRAFYFAIMNPDQSLPAFAFSPINAVSYLIFYVFAVMFTFGFVLMCNDRYIAQQKQLENDVSAGYEALKTSEQRLRRVMNSSLIGIVQGDATGLLKEANDVLLHMAGLRRQHFVEGVINWFDMAPPSAHAQQMQAITNLAQDIMITPFESQIQAQDGTVIPVMLGLASLEGSDKEWVGFVLDLREQKRIDQLKSEFISVVSHELRTPLTSIKGSLGLLEGGVAGELPPKALQLVNIAHKNSLRLENLVNDILDMERLASGKMNIHLQPVNLVSLAQQATEANSSYAEACKVSFLIGEHPDQAIVMGDADRLMQVFANLLSNAAKFSPPGGQVRLRILREQTVFRVEVEDHGSGIPLAFRERIFGKFAQADVTATRQLQGAGLGLNITKTLIENMGGEIGFSSEAGAATVFWFVLPQRQEHT